MNPSRQHSLKKTAAIVLSVKLYGFLLILILFSRTPLRNGDKGFAHKTPEQSSEERWQEIEERFWERLAPYDGQWYLDISERGYRRFTEPRYHSWIQPPGNYAFFPLLPVALRGLKLAFGGGYLPVALIVLLLVSACGILVASVIGRSLGIGAVMIALLLLSFPTAAFQYVLYTEGLFLLFSALTLTGL